MDNNESTGGETVQRSRADRLFLLSWKRVLLIIAAWVVSILLHNAIYGLFIDYFRRTGGDEPVFFLLAVIVIPLYFIISIVYTVIKKLR
ncbi:MAG: hypothetical protein JSV33_05060 [bacterium]|nr:MAG: hypothetical protein JSV33_05060 [bacterium]